MTVGNKAITKSDVVNEIKILLILNNESYSDEDRNVSRYINIGPDDAVHATLFAAQALELQSGMARF